MPLDFGDNAATPPGAPGASSAAAPAAVPPSLPLVSNAPMAWLALALAVGWILTR